MSRARRSDGDLKKSKILDAVGRLTALLQIAIDDKLNSFLATGSVYKSLPWSVFSGRNHSLGCALAL
ncbi:hypothetical protein ACX1NX_14650 [Acinetobacter sp. ANC 5383]